MALKTAPITSVVILLAAVLLPADTRGAAVKVFGQDAYALGRADTFVATADNPAAIFYNPAGITQLEGDQFRLGTYGVTYQIGYEDPAGNKTDSRQELLFAPQFYYTHAFTDCPLSLGLGAYVPFGLSMKWPESSGFRTVAMQGRINYLTVQPVLAWKITSTLSLAAGPTLNYSEATFQQGITPFVGNDYFRVTGDAFAPGFTLGLRWEPQAQHALGIVYRSATTLDYSGHSTASLNVPAVFLEQPAKARFEYPQSVTFGWSYRPTPEWNLELDAEWMDWSSLGTIPIRQATPVAPLVLNWRSSWNLSGGVTRKFMNGWRVSSGYMFSQDSVSTLDFTPLVPDTDRHSFTLGVGRDHGRWSWDLGYEVTRGSRRTVNGSNPSAALQSADGKYGWWSHGFSLSVGRRF